ncbi:MAG: hypothetical protein WCF95_04375, partial [bacterium]
MTKEKFIEKSIKKHGNKYDYSLVNYLNNKIKINIICPEHGIFEQTPNQHLSGQGCKKCHVLNTKIFIERSEKIHGEKYDYSLVDYVNSHIKIKIICPEHNIFEQYPYCHLEVQGCPSCYNKNIDTKIVIKRAENIHGNKYNYSLINYINSK